MATAYTVVFIDIQGTVPVVIGAGIFSEPHPTIDRPVRMAELFRVSAPTYAEAQDIAWQSLSSQAFDWLGRIVRERFSRVVPR